MESLTTVSLSPQSSVSEAARYLSARLEQLGFFSTAAPVLILSGGSTIEVAKEFFSSIPSDCSSITVLMADERFVPVTSPDCNYQQLKSAGVIQLIEDARHTFMPLYTGEASTGTVAATDVNHQYEAVLQQATMVVLLAGVGADGHTLGILPTSSARTFSYLFADNNYVTYYEVDPNDSSNQFKQRLTTTLRTLAKTDYVFIYACGSEKHSTLQALKDKNKPLHVVPALALYLSQQPLTLLTDQHV